MNEINENQTIFGKLDLLPGLFLFFGGLIPFAIGVAHLFLPSYGFDRSVLDGFSAEIRNHFVYLSLYAIASFLLCFGFFSFYMSFRPVSEATAVFNLLMVLVWGTRTLLEVLYPVELALFQVQNPTGNILFTTSLATSLYLASFVMTMVVLQRKNFLPVQENVQKKV